jgi:hypothetical protein
MALQTSKAQGKAITGQTIFEVANEIIRNPNGTLTQAIIQLAKLDTNDGGKIGQTVNVIKRVVSNGGGDSNGDRRDGGKSCPSGHEKAKDGSGICLKRYDRGCPAGSANPKEGCTLEGYQPGPEGYGIYVHGVCETCPGLAPTTTQPPEKGGLGTIGDIWAEIAKEVGAGTAARFVKEVVDLYTVTQLGPAGPKLLGGIGASSRTWISRY